AVDASLPPPAVEVVRPVEVVVAEALTLQADDAGAADQEVERKVADELSTGHEVRRSVEVGAYVERHGDLLPARLLECEPFDPADRGAGVAGERGGVQ